MISEQFMGIDAEEAFMVWFKVLALHWSNDRVIK